MRTVCPRVFSERRGRELSPLFHFMSNKELIMPKVTIEPFEGGYIVTFHTAGNPCAFFPTYAEAVAALI